MLMGILSQLSLRHGTCGADHVLPDVSVDLDSILLRWLSKTLFSVISGGGSICDGIGSG